MTQLPADEGDLFYKLHSALVFFANERLKLVPDEVADPEAYTSLPPDNRIKVRDALHAQPDLINEVPLEHFHFSQRRGIFEIGWSEGGEDLELRVYIHPEGPDEEI